MSEKKLDSQKEKERRKKFHNSVRAGDLIGKRG
jgi:hypothetical protein